MTLLPKTAMQKALALTRGGQLTEAMALLQGFVGGERSAGPSSDDTTAPAASRRSTMLENGASLLARPVLPQFVSPATGRPSASLPDGARFEDHVFSNAAGSRSYKLYVPSTAAGHPLPLVVMLHGCSQSPDDFAAGTRMNDLAEVYGCVVVYPAQAQAANAGRCWNWFVEGEQQRGKGEPSLIAGITRAVMDAVPIDPERVFVAGLSAGGAEAAILGMTYPDLYAAVGVHSGLACGAARDMSSAFAAMQQGAPQAGLGLRASRQMVPTIVFHGDRDTTVNPTNGDQVIAQALGTTSLRVTVSNGKSPGGTSYTRRQSADEAGRPLVEQWTLHGAGHAWSGGSAAGSYTDPAGPDASRAMMDFFLAQTGRMGRAVP